MAYLRASREESIAHQRQRVDQEFERGRELRVRDAEFQRWQETQNRDHERELWARDQEYQRRDEAQRMLFEQQADTNRQFQQMMMATSLQMANSVAQNAEVLRSFKRQSDEDTASDRDSVASIIRRCTSEGRTMVPLMYNADWGIGVLPRTSDGGPIGRTGSSHGHDPTEVGRGIADVRGNPDEFR